MNSKPPAAAGSLFCQIVAFQIKSDMDAVFRRLKPARSRIRLQRRGIILPRRQPSATKRRLNPHSLPPVMRERPVGFRHPIQVLAAFYRRALSSGRFHQLRRQPLRHRPASPSARGLYYPAHRKREPPLGANLRGYLVSRSAHTPGPHLHHWSGISQSLIEELQLRAPNLSRGQFQRVVNNSLRYGLFGRSSSRNL